MAPSAVQIGSGRFWSQISGGETYTPPQSNTQRKLYSHNRVRRQNIHHNYTRLGLQAKTSASVTARLHQESSQTVQPQTKEKPKTIIPKRPYKIWNQKRICHATIISATS